jgi:hypothetical protein
VALIYYAGSVWLNAPDWAVYGLIGFVIVVSPISWFADERKRARRKAEEAASAPSPATSDTGTPKVA